MPHIIWTRYFLMAQGFIIDDNIVHRDNKSSMLLEKNGQGSSGKRTRHINICYFFITDRINAKELSIKFRPTEMMVTDFYTKPLQGKLFRLFRSIILNIDDRSVNDFYDQFDTVTKINATESQECVEKNSPKLKSELKKEKLNIRDIEQKKNRVTYADVVKRH